ncbi:MAG: hypothetical protein ACTHJV_02745 [Rhizobiaceae bacterium]
MIDAKLHSNFLEKVCRPASAPVVIMALTDFKPRNTADISRPLPVAKTAPVA